MQFQIENRDMAKKIKQFLEGREKKQTFKRFEE